MFEMTHNTESEIIDDSIEQLKKYVNDSSIDPLIAALEALKKDPHNEPLLRVFTDEFAKLGIIRGAVLTYAPYISSLLLDDIFADIK